MIGRAVEILRNGGLVAFPTETVYGLGADARNAEAVAKIFAAKGRPATNPLICHVASVDVARRYAAEWPAIAARLAERFWPGALTLVVRSDASIVPSVRAGRETVGLRVPDHPLTRALLDAFDGPLAGPSANRSNHISPTTAQHVKDDLGDRVDLVLDGGACRVGIESTVLDLSGAVPTILRPGGVSRTDLQDEIGPVAMFSGSVDPVHPAAGPGMQSRHYSPRTGAIYGEHFQERPGRLVLQWVSDDPAVCARMFYAELRRLDGLNASEIAIPLPPDEPRWAALRDRIMRAAMRSCE